MRLDIEMVKRKLASTRSKAHFLIKSKAVKVNRRLELKPSKNINIDDEISLDLHFNPWVSRGGLKLDNLFKSLSIQKLEGKALDIGSSTGGFTEVLLHYGVGKVYSIDVGKNQMNNELRKNKKITLYEGLNAKNISNYDFPKFDIIVCDVSFISLKKFLQIPLKFSHEKTKLFLLVKPQFELEKKIKIKNGVIKDVEIHKKICNDLEDFLKILGWIVFKLEKSYIKGEDGNQEFFFYCRKNYSEF